MARTAAEVLALYAHRLAVAQGKNPTTVMIQARTEVRRLREKGGLVMGEEGADFTAATIRRSPPSGDAGGKPLRFIFIYQPRDRAGGCRDHHVQPA